jgi:hypothetical protein
VFAQSSLSSLCIIKFYNFFDWTFCVNKNTKNFSNTFFLCSSWSIVFPHIRPAGNIFSLGVQLRVLLLECHLHKSVPGASIIRNAGIIGGRALYEEILAIFGWKFFVDEDKQSFSALRLWRVRDHPFRTSKIDTVKDFLLDMKQYMHRLEISIFSLNNVTFRLTKIINNLLEHTVPNNSYRFWADLLIDGHV